MKRPKLIPIACTLAPGEYRERLGSIAGLARDALLGFKWRGRSIELRYAPEAVDRVREMVRKEQVCCAFLEFDLDETPQEVVLTIRAPKEAQSLLDAFRG